MSAAGAMISEAMVIRAAQRVEALLMAADCFQTGEEKMKRLLLLRAEVLTRYAFHYAGLAAQQRDRL